MGCLWLLAGVGLGIAALRLLGRAKGHAVYVALGLGLVAVLLFSWGYKQTAKTWKDLRALATPSRGTQRGDPGGAKITCEALVKARLKAPATAEFPGGYSRFTQDLGNGEYLVRSYVDSQNSFGAMLRQNFTCHVRQTGRYNFDLVELTFD